MDVLAVRRTVQEAVDRAREARLPTLIEARCYRYMGHSMSDPTAGVYRTREEVDEPKGRDPIRKFIDELQENGYLTQAELMAIDEEVHATVDDAAKFAEESPEPDASALYEDVYADMDVQGRLFFDGSGAGGGSV